MHSPIAQTIYKAVKLIPRGKVATYSQVAALAGNCKLRRFVGNALHENPEPSVQEEKLEAEGVAFTDGHVDMKKFCINEDDFERIRIDLITLQ